MLGSQLLAGRARRDGRARGRDRRGAAVGAAWPGSAAAGSGSPRATPSGVVGALDRDGRGDRRLVPAAARRDAADRLRQQRQPAVALRVGGHGAARPARVGDRHRGLGRDRRRGDRPDRWCRSRRRSPSSAGLPMLAGPYLVPVLFVGLAAILSFVAPPARPVRARRRDARARDRRTGDRRDGPMRPDPAPADGRRRLRRARSSASS